MSDKTDRLDVSQLAGRDLAKTAFPAARQEPFRVYFDPKIHQRIAAHAAEKLSLEICGVLVGDWHNDENGPYVLINEAVRADKAQSNAGDVTFTHDAWNEVNREMDTKFTDRKIVGWYHSHPNYGIFLSDRDRFCQDSTFNSPGQIAYVVDPVNGLEGVFCWRKGESKLLPHFWVGDEIHLSSRGKERKPSSAPLPEVPAATPRQEAPVQSSLVPLLLAAVCLLLGYLLGNMRSEHERLQTELGAVAQYGLFKGLKPGLGSELDRVKDNVAKIAMAVNTLAKEHIAAAGDAAEEKKKQWTEVLQALLITAGDVQNISRVYTLTPEEAKAVQELINQKEAETVNVPAGSAAAKPSGSQSPPKPSGEPAKPAKPSGEPSKH